MPYEFWFFNGIILKCNMQQVSLVIYFYDIYYEGEITNIEELGDFKIE